MNNFIEQYKIDKSICDKLIQYYKNNEEYKSQGRSKNNAKDSTDVYFFNGSTDIDIKFFFKQLSICLENYIKKYKITTNLRTSTCNNIQYYKPGQGYPVLHYERDEEYPTRKLVYMLYLNTVTDKGGTEFLFQNIITPAVKGNLVIWPADFTHQHRGVISETQEKYIATGWVEIVL